MKILRTLTAIGLVSWGGLNLAGAQETTVFYEELPAEDRVVVEEPSEFVEDEFRQTGPAETTGLISAAIKAGNPIVLVNPLAPEYYGDGREFVNRDPETGEPKGIKVVEVTW